MYTPYIGDGVHGVTQPDIGLSSHVPDGRIPRNNIDNFGQQVDDCLVVLMLEVAIRLLKPLLNELEKVSDLSKFSDNPEICCKCVNGKMGKMEKYSAITARNMFTFITSTPA